MNNLITINHNLQPSKSVAAQLTDNIVSIVTEGNISPLEAMAKLKCLLTAFDDAEKIVKELAFEELSKYSEKSIEINGTKFEKCEVGTSYLYSDKLIDELETKLKERKELLKALKSQITQVDEESGEIITLYPATKKSTSSFKITLAK
jgi:PDZ domain-containing secreted protein